MKLPAPLCMLFHFLTRGRFLRDSGTLLWNSLEDNITQSRSLKIVQSKLKTHLFNVMNQN